MATPREVIDLIERFERNRESYCSSAYNETETHREFIDPFFKALGWDIDNEQGYAEAYKDVVHEDAIKIGGARKFFVEAKLKLHKQLATAMTKNERFVSRMCAEKEGVGS